VKFDQSYVISYLNIFLLYDQIEKSIPVLGICYGMQELAFKFGGEVAPSKEREFGRATLDITQENAEAASLLFEGVEQSQMWMSHGDKVVRLPDGFVNIAHTENSENAGDYL